MTNNNQKYNNNNGLNPNYLSGFTDGVVAFTLELVKMISINLVLVYIVVSKLVCTQRTKYYWKEYNHF